MAHSPMTTPVLDLFLRNFCGDADGLDLEVDPRDEMFAYTLEGEQGDADRAMLRYIAEGMRVCQSMVDVGKWRFDDLSAITILDFASGYGRVTRHTIRQFRADRVTISDVVADAVEFQRRRFGVRAVVSTTRPEDLALEDRFDLVFVTSLFSHLPEGSFRAWLRRLFEATSDRGILAFSVHDRTLFGRAGEGLNAPFLFVPVSESKVLEGGEYGTMWVSEGFVREVLREISPSASCHRIPRGMGNFQDLYLVVREADADFSGLRYDCGPVGFIDRASVEDGRLVVYGWASPGASGIGVDRVEAWFRGEPSAVVDRLVARPDVAEFFGDEGRLLSGWRFEIPLPRDVSFTETICVVAVSAMGRTVFLYCGSIDGLFRVSLGNDLEALGKEGSPEADPAESVEVVSVLEQRVQSLESTIAAMEASRFWKLRNAWFRLKGLFKGGESGA